MLGYMHRRISRNKILPFVFCISTILVFTQNGFAQSQTGFLLQCFNSKEAIKDPISNERKNYYLFTLFLDSDDFQRLNTDSIVYETDLNDYYFSEQLARLFKKKLQYIETTPRLKDVIDENCKLSKVIHIGDELIGSQNLHIKLDDDYQYNLTLTKVKISYCALHQYTDFDSLFKMKITLIDDPSILQLNSLEIEQFRTSLMKFKNLPLATSLLPQKTSEPMSFHEKTRVGRIILPRRVSSQN